MAEITDAELGELRRLLALASEKPSEITYADVLKISARNALPALLSRLATLEAALRECEDYFDQRADADCAGDPAAYAGNREMTLLGIVRRALRGLEGK